jgi:hypothetical protein
MSRFVKIYPDFIEQYRTLDDRSYVHQANQIGLPVTVGVEASVLTYLPEYSTEEANWQLPVSLERISTDTTACQIAWDQLKLLAGQTPDDSRLTAIVAGTVICEEAPPSLLPVEEQRRSGG